MSDQVIIYIAGGIFSLIGTVISAFIAVYMFRLNELSKQAAVERAAIAKVADATHTLVNNNMGLQLRMTAVMSRTVADLRGSPADIKNAEEAELLLAEHQSLQDKVDAKYPAGIPKSHAP